jgi:hypothetical protein
MKYYHYFLSYQHLLVTEYKPNFSLDKIQSSLNVQGNSKAKVTPARSSNNMKAKM